MKNNIINLLDFERINTLLEDFNKTTGFVTAILDLKGNVLSKSGWRNICSDFHRVQALTAKRCSISDTKLANKMAEGEKYHFYKCQNGLVDVAVPMVINGEHVANIFSGQFFFEEPDRNLFVNQAKKYNFNVEKYMKALADVPIFSEEQVKPAMDFLTNMTALIGEMTMQRMEQIRLNEEIKENQLQLQKQNAKLHKSKEKAEESEKMYRLLFESNPQPMWVYDLETLNFLEVNKLAVLKYGFSREEFLTMNLSDIRPTDDVEKLIDNVNHNFDEFSNSGEWIHKNKNGDTFIVEIVSHQINYNNRNARLVLVNDITDRKLAAAELLGREEKFKAVAEVSPLAIYSSSGSNQLAQYMNPTFHRMFGYLWDDVPTVEQWWIKAFPDEKYRMQVMTEWQNGIELAIKNHTDVKPYECVCTCKDGSEKTIAWSAKNIGDEFWAFGHDLTEHIKSEESLKESEEKFRNMFENSPVGKLMIDIDGTMNVNKSFCEMLGYSKMELKSKNWQELSHPEEIQNFNNIFQSLNDEKSSSVRFEKRYLHKNGSIVWADASTYLQRDVHGVPQFYITSVNDITNRKLAEKALKESEEKYRSIFENSSVAILLTDPDGHILSANDFACKIFERTEKEICETGRSGLIDLTDSRLAKFLKDRENTGSCIGELTLVKKDGSKFEAEVSSVVFIDMEGKKRTSMVIRDLTQQKKAEKQLKKSEDRLKKLNEELEQRILDRTKELTDLYDNAPCGYHSLNKDGIILHINETELKMIGYTKDEVVNKMKISEILTPESQEKFKKSYPSFIKEGFLKDIEFDFVKKDNTIIPILLSAAAVYDSDNNYLMSRSTLIDNTNLKQAKDEVLKAKLTLEAANKELETFTYSVSHDLKAPLRGIDGYSELLSNLYGNQLNAEANHFINTIRNSTLQMNQLIEDLLKYSRLERSQRQIQPVKIRSVIESILKLNEDEILAHQFSVKVDVPDMKLFADLNGIQIALRNLIENAIKFTKKMANPEILIKLVENKDFWIISVRDNGIGFDMKYSERIFEIFQRLQRAEDYSGTGIGLAMVAKAMQGMNGKVHAESVLGQGSIFYLEISKTNQ